MGFLANLIGAQNNYAVSENVPEEFRLQNYRPQLTQALKGIATPQFDAGMANNTAAQQDNLIAALNQQLNGGPSVAQNQLQQATQANIANAAGQIGSIRGMNPALAARLIAGNAANQNQLAVGQGAELRAAETANTQNLLANALSNKRQADIGQATNAAQIGLGGLDSQTSRINTLGNLNNQQNNSVVSNKLGSSQINAGVAQQNANTAGSIAGGLLGGISSAILPMSDGGYIPGQPSVPGDHPANDKVPAMLSPGEIVIPRSKTDPDKAKAFIESLQSKTKRDALDTKAKTVGYADVLASQRGLDERLNIIEMACGGMVGMSQGGYVPTPPPRNPHGEFLSSLGAAYLQRRMRGGG